MYCAPVICSVAAGFIDADDAAQVPSAVAVESTYGLKSTWSLNEYSLPDILDTNTGISCVVIAVVFAVFASSIESWYDW